MVNFQDPYVLYLSARAEILVVHICAGMYTWEVLTTLGFDWKLLMGKYKFKIGAAFYLSARYLTLAALVLAVRVCNMLVDDHCQEWLYALYTLTFLGVEASTTLLMFRVFALSSNNKFVIGILSTLWLASLALVGYSVYISNSLYVPLLFLCGPANQSVHNNILYYQFGFDCLCLGLMIYFLVRMHRGGSLWQLMMQQGVVYVSVITIAYLLSVVMVTVKTNDAIEAIPTILATFLIAICGTRMHRGLTEFISDSSGSRPHIGSGSHHVTSGTHHTRPPRMINITSKLETTVELDDFQEHKYNTTSKPSGYAV